MHLDKEHTNGHALASGRIHIWRPHVGGTLDRGWSVMKRVNVKCLFAMVLHGALAIFCAALTGVAVTTTFKAFAVPAGLCAIAFAIWAVADYCEATGLR